ncbi:MAG: hypothetical protein HYX20_00700 [Candidatus Yanofskybacteria bacterium]|nr:hypothetical protein [Candidatus Yanofskybacteria bacterium]
MEQKNTPRIDLEELLKKAEPFIKTAVGAMAMGRAIQAKLESLTFEEQLLARYDRLTSMGLTEEQATATLMQAIDNIVVKGKNKNQGGDNHE